ncbi:MAG: AAA family ATPase [Proteobacteria bacterium]|nr:AAA family ATPase [Pseudomonadota bacterium]
MFLRHLKLQNVRAIRELELSFITATGGRKWTYLLGENGTGKSSVLRAIALVMAGADAIGELVGDPDEWIRLREDTASIEIVFATADNLERRAALHFKRGQSHFEFLDSNRETLRQIDAAVAKADRNYFLVGYGVSRRASNERFSSVGVSPFRSARAQATGTLFSGDAPLVSLEHWAMDLDYRRGGHGLEVVENAFHTLLPDVDFSRIDRERRRLLFSTLDGELPLAALSDGYQAMAAWCGDLLFRITETFADRSDPLKARGVLLVDEIDLHLHPIWQRRLVEFLRQTLPNLQVVLTTHSPLTIHSADEGELFVMRRQPHDGTIMEAYPGAPNKLMLPQLLQSPIFGLETLDSPQVAAARDELRSLQGIGTGQNAQDAETKRRVRALTAELSDVPNWREVPPYLAATNRLLELVARELSTKDDDDPIKTLAAAKKPARKKKS